MRRLPVFFPAIALIFVSSEARAVYHGKLVRQLPMQAAEKTALAKSSATRAHYWPHPTGVRPLLALLVDFSDAPSDFPVAEVDSFLNNPGYKRYGNNGSVRDFYLDVTRGKLDIHYKVMGYYRAKQKKTYYETRGNYAGGDELVAEVVNAFDAKVDFKTIGTPGDSAVNSVAILYAGAEHNGDLWGTTGEYDLQVDGRPLGRAYWAALGKTEMTIATLCHEMGHMMFNWPDLYGVPKDGVDAHCLMGNYADDLNPIPPDEALTVDQGWLDAQDLTAGSQGIFTAPENADKVFCFVNPARATESFFLVNRKNDNRYASLGGRGILIFHFDMTWNETSDTTKAAVMLTAASGRLKVPSNWVEPAEYFYKENMEEFSAAKQPTESEWHNGQASGIRLHDISSLSDSMTFAMGDAQVAVRALSVNHAPSKMSMRPGYAANGAWKNSGKETVKFQVGDAFPIESPK